jgi:hypothetical protein
VKGASKLTVVEIDFGRRPRGIVWVPKKMA